MRYIPTTDVESVLRRGKSVEQFLGKARDGETLRWVELRPANDVAEVWVFEEVGASFEEPPACLPLVEAVAWSERNLETSPNRWVNQDVVQSEYAENFA